LKTRIALACNIRAGIQSGSIDRVVLHIDADDGRHPRDRKNVEPRLDVRCCAVLAESKRLLSAEQRGALAQMAPPGMA
jgi:hypothetical protein